LPDFRVLHQRTHRIVSPQSLQESQSLFPIPPELRQEAQTIKGIGGVGPSRKFQNQAPEVYFSHGGIHRQLASEPDAPLPILPAGGGEAGVQPDHQGFPGFHDPALGHEGLHLVQRLGSLGHQSSGKHPAQGHCGE
jgi:hypothetical protein